MTGQTYPDGSVVCGLPETTPEDPEGIINPKVLVEVLSDSTEAYDRGDKFAHYRRLQSFKEYVLIGQKERLIEVHRRTGPSEWEVRYFGPGEQVELASLEVRLSIDAIYATPVG